MKFDISGFGDQWVEVFRTGRQRDSVGNVRNWTDDDLDKIISQYEPAKHEAPAVIGHPKDNSPAYGWVEALKKENDLLLAKFKDVVPEFGEAIRRGLFKKRSIALYPDLRLRHIGFLGAAPPAVKGLSNIKFSDDDNLITLEFADKEDSNKHSKKKREGEAMSFKEKMIAFYETLSESEFVEYFKGQKHSTDPKEKKDDPVTFSEADMKAATDAAIAKAVKETEAKSEKEFAEKEEILRVSKTNEEIKSFCDGLSREGKIIPAWVKLGVKEFMESLVDDSTSLQFGEGAKQTKLDFFKSFLAALPEVIDFSEVAKRGDDDTNLTEGEKFEAFVAKAMKDNEGLTYTEAMDIAQREHPKMALTYSKNVTQH